jgi:hypothetical protein
MLSFLVSKNKSKIMKNKITENTTIKDILKVKGGEEILGKYRLPCLSCPMASLELTELEIGKVCKMYGLDLKNILKEINELIE